MKKNIIKNIIIIVVLFSVFLLSLGCKERKSFTVTYNASEGGQVIGILSQTIDYGANGTSVTAEADTGYEFVKWSDGETDATRQETNVIEEKILTAEFKKKTFDVNYQAGVGGEIVGEDNQTIDYGTNGISVTAKAFAGYEFVKWSDGEQKATRRDYITFEVHVTAEFRFLFGGGEGTIAAPFQIATYEHFLNMKKWSSAYYILENDLDLNEIKHEPTFNDSNNFEGMFNGNNHTIKNLSVDVKSEFPSLFGFIGTYGSVQNLNITNAIIKLPNFETLNNPLCVGIVAGVSLGYLYNNNVEGYITGESIKYSGIAIGGLVGQSQSIIENCHANIVIEILNYGGQNHPLNIGGLVGVTDSDIFSSTAKGSIGLLSENEQEPYIERDIRVGGLIGVIFVDATVPNLTIYNCSTALNINSDYYSVVGGLLGESMTQQNPNFTTTIINCFATGDVSSFSGSSAGLINNCNNNDNSIFSYCYATGNVSNMNGIAAGFMVKGNGTVSYCYALGDVIGTMYASGFCNFLTGNIYRSFSKSNVQSNEIASGFIVYGATNLAEECFSTGTVISTCTEESGWAVSGLFFIMVGVMRNCYSISDLVLFNDNINKSIAAVGLSLTGEMINCYYAGKIIINETASVNSRLGTLTWGMGKADIKNCHWLYFSDSLVNYPYIWNRSEDLITETYKYENIEEMFSDSLINALNDGSDEIIWVQNENSTPQLKFVSEFTIQ